MAKTYILFLVEIRFLPHVGLLILSKLEEEFGGLTLGDTNSKK